MSDPYEDYLQRIFLLTHGRSPEPNRDVRCAAYCLRRIYDHANNSLPPADPIWMEWLRRNIGK